MWRPKFFAKAPDGGRDSGVTGYFLIEWKSAFSIVLLHFRPGTREAYHTHAFNAWTLWLKGRVCEHHRDRTKQEWKAGDLKFTPRECFHKIESLGHAWALSVRGPWAGEWWEERNGWLYRLTHGRREVPDDLEA